MRVSSYSKVDAVEQKDMVSSVLGGIIRILYTIGAVFEGNKKFGL